MGDFFVRRPIVAMVIAIFMVIVGVVFLGGLPTEQYPNITPPIVEVRATYTGANAVSVEQSVATPLEQQIKDALFRAIVHCAMPRPIKVEADLDPELLQQLAEKLVVTVPDALFIQGDQEKVRRPEQINKALPVAPSQTLTGQGDDGAADRGADGPRGAVHGFQRRGDPLEKSNRTLGREPLVLPSDLLDLGHGLTDALDRRLRFPAKGVAAEAGTECPWM